MKESIKNDTVHKNFHDFLIGKTAEWRIQMKHLLSKLEHETLVEEMEAFIKYVEEEILNHNASEEAPGGLYEEILREKPEFQNKIQHFIRDHQLIRIIVDLMKKELDEENIDFQKLVDYSSTITLINEIHSRDEEESLMEND
jgi:hypothetical protein